MTEILKCPLLPDVEPAVRSDFPLWFVRGKGANDPEAVYGPFAASPEEAVALWNAWMQPLHDLKAENERQREKIAQLEAQVAFLQGGLHTNDDTVKWIRKPLPRSGDAP